MTRMDLSDSVWANTAARAVLELENCAHWAFALHLSEYGGNPGAQRVGPDDPLQLPARNFGE